jgi:drug/metabolite transporter (DMT)-like permease
VTAAGARPARSGSEPWSVHAALLAAQTGFALFPIFGKLALATMPPLVLAALRVTAAALLLEGARRLTVSKSLARADRKAVLLYGVLGVSLNQVLFILGLSLTTVINTTILMATIPVFTLAVAVLLGREAMSARAGIGLLLAGAGALLLLDVHRFDWHSRAIQGNLLLLANALSYSFYLVLSRPILARYSVLTIVSHVFLYGAIPILLFTAPAVAAFAPASVTPLSWVSLGVVVVFCTVMPYAANSWALARTHASRVAFYVFVQPLIASTLAVAVLRESLTARTAGAGLLILAGLAVSLVRGRLPARPLP